MWTSTYEQSRCTWRARITTHRSQWPSRCISKMRLQEFPSWFWDRLAGEYIEYIKTMKNMLTDWRCLPGDIWKSKNTDGMWQNHHRSTVHIYIYIYIYYIYIDYIYIHRAVKETLKLLHHVIPSSIIHFACVHFELSRPELRCDRSDIWHATQTFPWPLWRSVRVRVTFTRA